MALSTEDSEQLNILEGRIRELEARKGDLQRKLPLYDELRTAIEKGNVRATQLMQELGLEGPIKNVVFPRVRILAERNIWGLERKIHNSRLQVINVGDYNLGKAYGIFGDNFYGPAHVQRAFGIEVPKHEVTALPNKELMSSAYSLGAVLALRVYHEDKNQGRKPEWKMFRTELLDGTIFKTYLEQTRVLRNYLAAHGFLSAKDAEQCTDSELKRIQELAERDPVATMRILTNLGINQNHRNSVDDVWYFDKLTTVYQDPAKGQRPGECYKSIFTDGQFAISSLAEATNTMVKDFPAVFVVHHFGDTRGLDKDPMLFNKTSGSGFGGSYRQGVRVVF